MTNLSALPTLLISALMLFSGCTDSGSPTDKESSKSTALSEATPRTGGARADSLGGIPGHKFGEPLSAFPGLELTVTQQPGSQAYQYPAGKGEPGWFGKHKLESPNEFFSYYIFKDGRFVAFQAMALGTGRMALREQATYLFRTGTQTSTTTNWEGEQVLAYYSQAMQPGAGPSETLDVKSQNFVRSQASARADKLKQENAL